MNVIADWEATTGLGEAARRSAGALMEAGVAVAASGVKSSLSPGIRDALLRGFG